MVKNDKKISDGLGWVIGIGASAGGLEALTLFVANLPASFAGTVIIAQHLAPHAKSMMVELLQRHSKLQVVSPVENEEIKPGLIYIAPPNHDIEISENRVHLNLAGSETRPKPSVNSFFQSLARSYGDRSVGIILSGTGSDGSEGIQAIKAVGGLTLAQDDISSKYDGMPKSAINTGDIDSVLPPEVIAKTLGKLLDEHIERIQINEVDDSSLKRILSLVKESHGTDFRQYKRSTVLRRTVKRMHSVGLSSFDDYFDLLEKNPGEVGQLAQEMLVSVTSFFRDTDVFEKVAESLNKIVSQKKSHEELRLWVAGCATGEEAYSIAILILESMARQQKILDLKIFATDLDLDAILEARNGFYTEKECESVPDDLLARYFERRDGGFEVAKRLRDVVVFARQDLTQNPPFVRVDFISCRNLLIYFDAELQTKVIEIFHYALNASGTLLLGKSETVPVVNQLFKTIDRTAKLFTKLNVPSKPLMQAKAARALPLITPRARQHVGPSLAESSYLRLLTSYGISGVTIDEEATILQIIGDVSPYLGFFTPQPDFRLTSLLPKGVGVEIPLLIRKALKDGGVQKSRLYKGGAKKSEPFYILIRSLREVQEEADGKALFVVNFEPKKKSEAVPVSATVDGQLPQRMGELEQELFVTREHLQTVIEELGVSNEELQSLNEELSSTNEELQASSEELETTNEELQSSNEELTTLNEEMSTKQIELKQLNVSFENVQNSIGSPLIIVDSQKRVIRYNPESLRLFGFTTSDIGRDISRVSSNVEIENFNEIISAAVENGTSSECSVEIGSIIYQLRVLPCLDDQRTITGAILIFINNTDLIKYQKRLELSDRQMRAIINGSDSLVSLKDPSGRYILVNDAFREFLNLPESEIIGKTDREVLPKSVAVEAREADLEVLVKGTSKKSQHYNVEIAGTKKSFVTTRFLLRESENSQPYAIGAISVDITPQVQAQEELEKSRMRYRAIVEDQAVFVARFRPSGEMTFGNALFLAQFPEIFKNEKKNFESVIAEVDRYKLAKAIAEISPERPIIQFDHLVVNSRAPNSKWLRWILRGIYDSNKMLNEFQAVGFDITESTRKTGELIERDNVYSRAFDHTIDFLSVYRFEDGQFYLESFNRSAAKSMIGSQSQLIGRNLLELVDSQSAPMILEKYKACVNTGTSQLYEEQIRLPSGIQYFSTTLIPVPNQEGVIERVAAMSRDISAQKRIENDLRAAKEEADSANKSKSDFLATMSHELRTPLNVVLGMSELLSETKLNEDQFEFVRSINRSGALLLSLIEDILDVAKIEAGKVTLESVSFSPADVVDEVMDLFKIQAGQKNLDLLTNVEVVGGDSVVGDPLRFRQVLTNLVGNAVKFTDSGSITVNVKSQPDVSGKVVWYTVSVKDTGIGISEPAQAKLFQRFSQVDSGNSRKFGGSGLGLVISKQLVTLMGGSIKLQSRIKEGTTFTVSLPFTRSPDYRPSAESSQKTNTVSATVDTPSRLRVLAVDDNQDNRTLIGIFLKKLGHEADVVGSGEEALKLLISKSYHLILMDVQMPHMNGYETTAAIRFLDDKNKSRVPVIALTANAMRGDVEKAFKEGMDDYITKPIDLNALKTVLNKWAEKLMPEGENGKK